MTDTTDREIYEKMTHGSNVPFVSDRVELMLRDAKVLPQCHHPARSLSLSYLWACVNRSIPWYHARVQSHKVFTRNECLAYLGARFRIAMKVSERLTDIEVGQRLLRNHVLVHLDSPYDKFHLLLYALPPCRYTAHANHR